jgi:NAD(P)-dependent dehydrogenase (short-subunit alcohol dehydrogenase family)
MTTILITGASRGIGMASALYLARAGYDVIAAMRHPAGSELAAALTAGKLPIRLETLDVDSDASVAACFARVLAQGPLDVLVNNAGIERSGAVEETPLADFRTCMETNYFGALRCIQAVVGAMRARGQGLIVNVTSIAGRIASSPLGPYAASKFALEAASEALAQELKPFGVRVAIVQPGIMDTRMARNLEHMPAGSGAYPQSRRMAALYKAVIAAGAGRPELVGETIRNLIESGTWMLRHPVGPDAAPFLAWRAAMSDEQWVAWGALDDEAWRAAVRNDFGLELRW